MAKSLIEELPRIVSEGRREAAQILERLSSGTQRNASAQPPD